MFFLPGISQTGQDLVTAAFGHLEKEYPSVVARALVATIPLPELIHGIDDRYCGGRLHGYAMCLNHWLWFLPVPVILINAEWLRDCGRLRQRYGHDVATGYHPGCDCPVKYVIAHEIAHFIYVRMGKAKREAWKRSFVPGKPSGYSTTAEEGFCEAFAGAIAGQKGPDFELAATLARHGR